MGSKVSATGRRKNPSRVKAKRAYNNESRLAKIQESQKLIIETLVALLVERKGGDVTFEEIADNTKISARTIYRFFKDKETLHAAMDQYLMSYLENASEQMSRLDFVGFGKNVFQLFDHNEDLTMAYIYSPFGLEARELFRKRLNLVMMAKIMEKCPAPLTEEKRRRIALITSLVNAKIWHDIRADWGFTGSQMGEAVGWALSLLLNHLDES